MNIIETYDYLHTIPEVGFEEVQTAAFLATELEKLGLKVTRNVGKTGVVGMYDSGVAGPTLMVRADMDALPFVTDEGEKYNKHACGHDAHCAMQLEAVKNALSTIKKGKLKVLFQPAEEILTGALAIIDAGVIDDVDIALGMHVRPIQDIEDGTLAPAVKHSASTFIHVHIEGVGTHASRPHLGVNALEAATQIVNAVNAIKVNPTLAWSCKVTGIHGGMLASNIIPDKAKMIFDVRAQTNELMDELLKKFEMAVVNGAAAVGAKAEVVFPGGVIPAAQLNDEMTAMIAETIKEVMGEDKLRPEILNPGGEDFHYYAYKFPNLKAGYFGVGAGVTPGLHAKDMELNKNSLENGAKVMAAMITKILG